LVITVFAAAQSSRGMEKNTQASVATSSVNWRHYLVLLRDRNVFILMIFKFLGAVATGSLIASLPYFSKYILGDEGKSTIGLALYITVAAICVPLWEKLSRSYDKRRLLLWGMIGLGLLLLAIGTLITSDMILMFYIGCALMGTVMSSYTLIAYSFPPDLVDYYEHQTAERHESIIFGVWLTSHQLGIALAGLLLGFFLQVFGYDGSKAEQTASALIAVRLSLGLMPGIFMLIAVTVLQKYGITRSAYNEIRASLDKRSPSKIEGELAGD